MTGLAGASCAERISEADEAGLADETALVDDASPAESGTTADRDLAPPSEGASSPGRDEAAGGSDRATGPIGPEPWDPPPIGGCESPGRVSRITVDDGGTEVDVRVLKPTDFDGQPRPAVINWHGLGSSGTQQRLLTTYEVLAEREGFIAVHPTGAVTPALDGEETSSWELAQFDDPDRDDIEMARALIDRLVTEHCVDPNRIYSTGFSNGAFFTARLVCELADRIAAAVSVAGVSHPDDCQPVRPVPYLAYHGTADDVVPFDGGSSSLDEPDSPPEVREFFDQVMPDEFAQFAADFGCRSDPDPSSISSSVTRYDYRDCRDDVALAFVEIDEGGHTWPNSPIGILLSRDLGATTRDVDATVDGWQFMSQFSLAD